MTDIGHGMTVDGTISARQAAKAGECVVLGDDLKIPSTMYDAGGVGEWLPATTTDLTDYLDKSAIKIKARIVPINADGFAAVELIVEDFSERSRLRENLGVDMGYGPLPLAGLTVPFGTNDDLEPLSVWFNAGRGAMGEEDYFVYYRLGTSGTPHQATFVLPSDFEWQADTIDTESGIFTLYYKD